MRQLILDAVLGRHSRGVAAADDDDLAVLRRVHGRVERLLGALCEVVELEDAGGAVPEDGLGLVDGGFVERDGFVAAVQTHPAVGDAVFVLCVPGLGVGGEFVGCDVVDGEDDLDVVLLGFFDEGGYGFGAGFVEERGADRDVFERLLEGEGHAAADDERVDLVEKVVDELDLVGDLCAAEDGEEGPGGGFEGFGEVIEFLLHEEAGGFLGKIDADHGGVGAVGGAESVVCGGGCQ